MEKIQLHQSMIGMLYKCGEQFRRRYGARFGLNDREEIIPPDSAKIIGNSVHKTVESNLNAKIETGQLLTIEQVLDLARDVVEDYWQAEVFLQEEEAMDPKKTKGDCIDTSIALSRLHAMRLAPKLSPKSTERKWVIELVNFPYDLAGSWDVEEIDGTIRDTKTSSKTPAQGFVDTSEQLTIYSLAKKICDGQEAPSLFMDYLIKTKEPKLIIFKTHRTDAQRQMTLRRIERVQEIIQKGAFTPANPGDWVCTPKWCGYYHTCPYGGK